MNFYFDAEIQVVIVSDRFLNAFFARFGSGGRERARGERLFSHP
jgi:hypothetical protein